jgi:hypothetical protein
MTRVFSVFLRRTSIWIYLSLCAVLLALQLHWGVFLANLPLAALVVLVPFYEWIVHKYFLHLSFRSRFPRFQNYLNTIHSSHHADPKEVTTTFAPVAIGLTIPIQFFLVFWLLSGSVETGVAAAFLTQAYYLFYEWMHLAHHLDFYRPKTAWGARLRRAHAWHHYKNEHYWWGVTSNFADRVLGTMPEPEDVARSHSVKELQSAAK